MRNLILILLLTLATSVMAEVANPEPAVVKQPDGTMLTIQLHGDEFNNHITTIDGYTVVMGTDGAYRYATVESGELVVTHIIAHDPDKRQMEEKAFCMRQAKHASIIRPIPGEESALRAPGAHKANTPLNRDNFRGLVILVNFNDCKYSYPNATEIFQDMICKPGYTGYQDPHEGWQTYTGSVRDYFEASSSGTFIPEFDIIGPIDIDYSMYYPMKHDNGKELALAVLDAADPYVDFTKYDADNDGRVDMFFILYAGYASNQTGNDTRLIWPYASNLTSSTKRHDGMLFNRYACGAEHYGWQTATRHDKVMCGIGTICHEFSHVLGLHDHYDTSSNGTIVPGSWDLMSAGSHNNKGRTPPYYNMYERWVLGMGRPEEITTTGTYTLPELGSSNMAYLLKSGYDKEQFIIENRQQSLWDASHAGKGMLVWRVDSSNVSKWTSNKVNTDPDHPLFELIRATPMWDSSKKNVTNSAGDPFPGSGAVHDLTNETSPASLLSWNGTPCPLLIQDITSSNGIITFTVAETEKVKEMETFSTIEPFEKTTSAVHQGNISQWTFTNAGVKRVSGVNGITGNAAALYVSGSVTSAVFNRGIDDLVYNVANGGTMNAIVRTYYSTDKGETWKQVGTSKMLTASATATISNKGVSIPAGSMVHINFVSGSQSTPVYVDNIEILFNNSTDGIDHIYTDDSSNGKAALDPIVYTSGKTVIRAKNKRKYIAK